MKKISELNFDLKQLRSFLAIIKEESFTRASRKLKLGQSTISHQVGSLEDLLGVKLIERTSKEFSITKEGLIFKEFCEKLFDDIEKLKDDFSSAEPSVVTRISASTIPSTYILPAIVAGIKKKRPNYYYDIATDNSREVIEMVKDGAAEIGIAGKMIKHPSLEYSHVFSDEIVLIGSDKSPAQLNISEIIKYPFITREAGSGTRTAYEKMLLNFDIKPSHLNVVFNCSSSESVKESVIAGLGVAFISKLAIENELKLKKMKIVKVKGFKLIRNFYAVRQKKKRLSSAAGFIIDELFNRDLKKT